MRLQRNTLVRAVAGLAATGFAVFSLAAPAVAGGGGGGACSGFERGSSISITDFCFQGVAHFVAPNATVTVRNDGETTHDIRAVDGSFASSMLQPGDTYQFDAPASGVIPYYCSLHGTAQGQGMTGVLVVDDASGTGADALAASVPTGNGTAATAAALPAAESDDSALIVGSFALVVGVLALAGVIGTMLARFMRSSTT